MIKNKQLKNINEINLLPAPGIKDRKVAENEKADPFIYFLLYS